MKRFNKIYFKIIILVIDVLTYEGMMSIHGRVINRPHLFQVTRICTVNDSCFIRKYPLLSLNPFHTYEVDYSIY